MKRIVVVGHRGVGKTSFLARVQAVYAKASRSLTCLDLDREIERRTGRTVQEIFAAEGENAFRDIERETFRSIDSETSDSVEDVYLACGGGFDPAAIGTSWRVLWLRRPSDSRGRIFIDRPRLDAAVSAIEEFQERYRVREPRFRSRADDSLLLDEGLTGDDPAEQAYVLGTARNIGGTITLLAEQFRHPQALQNWIGARLEWGIASFELRDDLLTEEQMRLALKHLPSDRVLLSFRDHSRRESTKRMVASVGAAFDWPLELGAVSFGEPRYLSWHRRDEGQSLADALAAIPPVKSAQTIVKAALPTLDFEELLLGHSWQQVDPSKRVFLPHSPDGRWAWYRLWRSRDQALGFFRESEGSALDQPTLLQWIRQSFLIETRAFAAVLGDPISHSRSPLEQAPYFASLSAPIYPIRVAREEWSSALRVLTALGLRWCAVTAPLKGLAFESCTRRDALSEKLQAANTLAFRAGEWACTNTDLEGFRASVTQAQIEGEVAIWGGGGTLEMMREVLPDADLYSARTGAMRDEFAAVHPQTLVWASGRQGLAQPILQTWKPKCVIDLDYAEDAPARALALGWGARYISGLTMFKAQAIAQRRFWEQK